MNKFFKRSFFYILMATAASISLTSCKDDDKNEPDTPDSPASNCNVQITDDVELYNAIGVELQSSENVDYMYVIGMETSSIEMYSDKELIGMIENSNLTKSSADLKYSTLWQLKENTEYTFLILPYTEKNLRGSLTRKTYRTGSLTDQTPICNFSNYWATGSTINWEVTPTSSTGAWYTVYWGGEKADEMVDINAGYVAFAIRDRIENESIAIYNGTQEFSYQPEDPEADTNKVVAATWGVSKSGEFSSVISSTIINLKDSKVWVEKPKLMSPAKDGKIHSGVITEGITQSEMDEIKKAIRITLRK